MHKLITICCWFGTLPEHFPEFSRSVAMNPTIDFLLVTDCQIPNPPSNMSIYPCSFEEVHARFQSLFDFPICLEKPYKLCDFRPVWPLAFQEFLNGYDFWGHCDMDMIFGDIRHFLSDETLSNHDKIYRLGHLSYYRNTNQVTSRYLLDGGVNYHTVFTSPEGFAFDEIAGMGNIYSRHNYPAYYSLDYIDITYGKVRFTRSLFHVPAELHASFNFEKQLFFWENGRVFRAYWFGNQIHQDEFNYIHFSKRKMPNHGVSENSNSFFITNRGLFPKNGPVVFEDFDRYNPHEPKLEARRSRECKRQARKNKNQYYLKIIKGKLGIQQGS